MVSVILRYMHSLWCFLVGFHRGVPYRVNVYRIHDLLLSAVDHSLNRVDVQNDGKNSRKILPGVIFDERLTPLLLNLRASLYLLLIILCLLIIASNTPTFYFFATPLNINMTIHFFIIYVIIILSTLILVNSRASLVISSLSISLCCPYRGRFTCVIFILLL